MAIFRKAEMMRFNFNHGISGLSFLPMKPWDFSVTGTRFFVYKEKALKWWTLGWGIPLTESTKVQDSVKEVIEKEEIDAIPIPIQWISTFHWGESALKMLLSWQFAGNYRPPWSRSRNVRSASLLCWELPWTRPSHPPTWGCDIENRMTSLCKSSNSWEVQWFWIQSREVTLRSPGETPKYFDKRIFLDVTLHWKDVPHSCSGTGQPFNCQIFPTLLTSTEAPAASVLREISTTVEAENHDLIPSWGEIPKLSKSKIIWELVNHNL